MTEVLRKYPKSGAGTGEDRQPGSVASLPGVPNRSAEDDLVDDDEDDRASRAPAATAPRIQASPPLWRERLLPRSVLGISAVVLAAAVGAAFSGVVLYSYYNYRLDQSEQRIDKFVGGFDNRFDTATKTIDAEREQAKAEIQKELEPLQKIQAGGATLEALLKKVQPSVWFVSTLDEAGQPSVGTAFVVASDSQQTLLLTSYTTIRANTRKPGPPGGITVRQGSTQMPATLFNFQAEKDLALLTLPKPNLPKLSFASGAPLRIGDRLFAVSGLGSLGAAISQGFVADVSTAGIQHDAPVGTAFQGGPLVNSDGAVLGIASRAYAPLGFTSDGVWFGVPIRDACQQILRCPSSGDPSSGKTP